MRITALLLLLFQLQAGIPYPEFVLPEYQSLDQNYVNLFRTIYERNIEAAKKDRSSKYRIPRIIHQIWLGSPVPEKYRVWMETWRDLEGWEYKLWTDEDAANLPMYNRELYESVTNPGEKSDILRLEILRQFGGVYVDVDLECFRPEFFEELHRAYDFYIGVEPFAHGVIYKFHLFKFCNAIIAALPNHQLIHDLVVNLKANYLAYLEHGSVVERTGPSYLTRIICEYEHRGAHPDRNMYLPVGFFYPFNICEVQDYLENREKFHQQFPECAGIHYWIGSWRDADCHYMKKG